MEELTKKSVGELLNTGSRKVKEVNQQEGTAIFEIEVRKNAGTDQEMKDTIEVEVPVTVEGLLSEYGENQIIKNTLRVVLADKATYHRKNNMVSEEEKQQKIKKNKEKVQKKIEQLKQAGLDMDEIKELIQ